ncbi:MAG TPA: ABC transporter permease subunit [Anaerolineaceae bacterium]|nr:ABC transporter permease subunit [Anaerolineaceae bacterium]
MSANTAFQPVTERGWRRGLNNLMNAEFSRWWKTRRWWMQALIWTMVSNGMVGLLLWSPEPPAFDEIVMLYCVLGGMFAAVAVIILMQDAIVGEKQAGTAAWLLSKPVARPAFILSRLVPNAAGILVNVLLIPGLLVFAQFRLHGAAQVNPITFLLALLVLGVNLLFFQALTLMLGTLFNQRGPVIGIALAFLFVQQYLIGFVPPLQHVLPYTLVLPLNDVGGAIAPMLIMGQQPGSWLPLFGTLGWIVLFIAVSIWRFNREEF